MWSEEELDKYAARWGEAAGWFDVGLYGGAAKALSGEMDNSASMREYLVLLRIRRRMDWRNGDPAAGEQYIVATCRGSVGLAVFSGKGWEWVDHRGRGLNAPVEGRVIAFRKMPEFPEHLRDLIEQKVPA